MRFKDKVVIITGAGAGMGKAAALAFVKEGANIVINDVKQENLDETVEEIRTLGGKVAALQGDVTQKECVKATVAKALEQFGKVDILFNYVGGNPGYAPMSPFMEQNEAYWEESLRLNLLSTMMFSQAVLADMIKRKYGKIINTSSIAGKEGGAKMVPYSASKGGVIAFTKALAKEVAEYKINVNCICPGSINTPGAATVAPGIKPKDSIAHMPPIGRTGRPEEVASLVLYLASDDAAYITGQSFTIDGGLTMS